MKKYIIPESELVLIHLEPYCVSFDSNDKTENWSIDDEETI